MTAKELGQQPAYPTHSVPAQVGLTKREAFAMHAMQGFCANASLMNKGYDELATIAVIQADVLLEQLAKEAE